jgi:pimeloyl-ACP methyl ester carboxylesterase
VAYVLGREDAVFNPAWSRRAARDRLRVEPVELEGGHFVPLTAPGAVADALAGLATARG